MKDALSVSTEDRDQIAEDEEEMLYKVFDFADKEVVRCDGAAARRGRDLGRHAAGGGASGGLDSPFTRYPVFRETPDEIIGVLHVRDLFSALNDRGIAGSAGGVLRPAYFVPETKDLAALLADFRRDEPAHGGRR